ncbi:MAG: phosphatidylglycerophosphatase A [Desulfobacterales bacterium]|nr:phosphatidylglycerophosphatase A [Desulfobacterales bacterium]
MNFKKKLVLFFATAFFSGYAPLVPGTVGSLVGIPICFFLSKIHFISAAVFIFTFISFAVWVAHEAEQILQQKDPNCIVIDEIAGLLVTFFGLPFTVPSAIAGFVLFRFFDIVKPFPVRYVERRVSGGAGVVMDDLAAGIYSHLILKWLIG